MHRQEELVKKSQNRLRSRTYETMETVTQVNKDFEEAHEFGTDIFENEI